jgi:hypothetical protein
MRGERGIIKAEINLTGSANFSGERRIFLGASRLLSGSSAAFGRSRHYFGFEFAPQRSRLGRRHEDWQALGSRPARLRGPTEIGMMITNGNCR